MPGGALSLALAAALLAPLVEGPAEAPLLGPAWRVATLPHQSQPVTRFSAERVDGRLALRIAADGSYGNLVHDLPGVPAPKRLLWSWRLHQASPSVDLRRKSGDDSAAKVCLSFDLPLEQLPFGERTLLKLYRASAGEPLPAATLCWVWGGPEAQGALLDNAYSRRVRYIVLRHAGDALDTWFDESRDIAADFLRAFGDEATSVPPLSAVLVGGDADNTHAQSLAHVAALHFEP
jgi:hypothetical protein